MIIDVLVTDQLNLFIVVYETYGQPEPRLCPLVVPYMAPGPSVQYFLISGSFFVILVGPWNMGLRDVPCNVARCSPGRPAWREDPAAIWCIVTSRGSPLHGGRRSTSQGRRACPLPRYRGWNSTTERTGTASSRFLPHHSSSAATL